MKARSPIWLWSFCLMVCLLAACPSLIAQGGGTDCWQVVSGSDLGCTRDHDCLSTDGCTGQTFTASCTGWYVIDAWTRCQENKCHDCMACVNIYEGDRWMANCHTTDCDQDDCEHSCIGQSGVYLQSGRSYTIRMCLIPCPPDTSCSQCGDDCKAYGCVRHNALPACWE